MPPRILRIFGIPMDLGQNRRGVDMGPSAIRYAGLKPRLERLGYEVHDMGNISVPVAEQVEHPYTGNGTAGRAHHLPQVAAVCQEIYALHERAYTSAECAIFLGGDHSISIGTVAGVSAQGEVGLLWFDAHADINTPRSSPSGNIHGMSVATLLGDGAPELTGIGGPGPRLRADQLVMLGLRELDPPEQQRLRQGGITIYTMRDIDEMGIGPVCRAAAEKLQAFDHIHVSLDLDGLDPQIAPGVGTPSPGGLRYREAHLLMEILADTGKVRTMDIVEVNPILDDRNRSAEVAVELAASLFGQRIL